MAQRRIIPRYNIVLAGPGDALPLFKALRGRRTECAAFAYFDRAWSLLGARYVSGSIDRVVVPMRAIVTDALLLDASLAVMAHNHPSGQTTPSEMDYVLTKRLGRTLDLVGVRLVDHFILAGDSHDSFRARGLL